MGKHTPGPWKAKHHHPNSVDVSGGEGLIANVSRWQSGVAGDFDENAANARLIAAAPELLVALQLAHDHLAPMYEGLDGEPHGPLATIRAALDKAEGKQP